MGWSGPQDSLGPRDDGLKMVFKQWDLGDLAGLGFRVQGVKGLGVFNPGTVSGTPSRDP